MTGNNSNKLNIEISNSKNKSKLKIGKLIEGIIKERNDINAIDIEYKNLVSQYDINYAMYLNKKKILQLLKTKNIKSNRECKKTGHKRTKSDIQYYKFNFINIDAKNNKGIIVKNIVNNNASKKSFNNYYNIDNNNSVIDNARNSEKEFFSNSYKPVNNPELTKISEDSLSFNNNNVIWSENTNNSNIINNNINYFKEFEYNFLKDGFSEHYQKLENKVKTNKSNKDINIEAMVSSNNNIISVFKSYNNHLDCVRTFNLINNKTYITTSDDNTLKVTNYLKNNTKTYRLFKNKIISSNNYKNNIIFGDNIGNIYKYYFENDTENIILKGHYNLNNNNNSNYLYPVWEINNHKSNVLVNNYNSLYFIKNQDIDTITKIAIRSATTAILFNNNNIVYSVSNKIFSHDLNSIANKKHASLSSTKNYISKLLNLNNINNLLIAGNNTGNIEVYDNRTLSNPFYAWKGHTDEVTSFINYSDNYLFGTTSHDGNIRFWDIRNFKCIFDAHLGIYKSNEGLLCSDNYKNYGGCGNSAGNIKLFKLNK